jgi:methionine-rich copper-binding protein CopC
MKRLGLITTLVVLSSASVAHAHARLVRSQPAKDARVAQSPTSIDLWFNELLDHGFNGIEVFAASESSSAQRTSLTSGTAVVDQHDRTHLSAPVPALPPGRYIIEYRVLSRDGHSAPGRIKFTVGALP